MISVDRALLVAGERERQLRRWNAATSGPSTSCADARLPRPRARACARRARPACAGTRRTSAGARPRACSAIDSGRWISRSTRVVRSTRSCAVEHRLVERIGEAARLVHFASASPTERAQLPREHLGLARLRVDGHDHAGLLVGDAGAAEHVDDRVRHLPLAAVHVELAEERHLGADASCFSRHAWLKNVMLSSDVPSWTTTSTSALAGRACGGRGSLRTSAIDRRLLADRELGDLGLLRAVDPAARVVLRAGRARCRCPSRRAAPRASAPTPFEVARARSSRRSRSVSGGSPAGTPVARATPRRRGTGTAAGRRRGTRPRRAGSATSMCSRIRSVSSAAASAPTSTVTISLSSSTSSSSSSHTASAGDVVAATMPSRVSAIQSPVAIGPHSADAVAHRLRDLAGAHALDAPPSSPRRSSSSDGVGVVLDERGERLDAPPWSATTATVLLGERVDLLRDRHDVLVVRQHDHARRPRTPRPPRGSARSTGSSTARPRRPAARRGS